MGKFFYQLKVMLWRNFILKKRMKGKTLFEFLMPVLMTSCIASFRIGQNTTIYEAQEEPQGHAFTNDSDYKLYQSLGVAPNTTAVRNLMERVEAKFHMKSIEWFSSEEEMNKYYLTNSSNFQAGIIFTEDPYTNSSYTLRLSADSVPSTDKYFSEIGDCRVKDTNPFSLSNFACPALKYYSSGFVSLQALIDRLLIEESIGKSINVSTDLKVYPKDKYVASSTVLRAVVPLYLILAFTPLISILTLLIVEEKEKKIKEGMLMMGLDVLAYWLAWFIIESVLVILISILMTGLLKVLNIFQNTNFIIIFILILLFGLSAIMLSFMATPFFNSSKVAGSVMGVLVLFLSLFYLLATYVKDKVGSIGFHFLALLSPAAYSLGFESVVTFDINGKMSWDEVFTGVFPVGSAMIMLLVDITLYGLLAYYFDSVIPGEFGPRRKPWFFLLPSFWRSKESAQGNHAHPEVLDCDLAQPNIDVEPVSADIEEKEAIKILNIAKTFKGSDGIDIKAVDGINLSIYEDQITALLGHNGAGKTTLISMLTGILTPSSGTAYMYGENISNISSLLKIRSQTGVCLQENILLNELNAEEHLKFFAMLKGVPPERLNSEVEQTLHDVDMVLNREIPSKKLSGGNKRKLCVGIALIGDPKIVYLDEPTSGVDPYSRRLLWSYLQHKKKGKVIVLTTHSMDEADILSDRKAIISKGKLKCAGSSLFLKNKFGVGYHLTLTVSSLAVFKDIQNLVLSTIVTAKPSRESSLELSFILPLEEVSKFPLLFADIEKAISDQQFGIINYAVSMTTLEEVFLSLAEDTEEEEDAETLYANSHSAQESLTIMDSSFTAFTKTNVSPSFTQAFLEFLKLRFILFLRQPAHIFPIIILPSILVIATYFLMRNVENQSLPSALQLSPTLYNEFDFKLYGNDLKLEFSSISEALLTEKQSVSSLSDSPTYDNLLTSCMALMINSSSTSSKIYWSWIFNDSCMHSLPIFQNIMSNVLLRGYSTSNKTISIATYPLPSKDKDNTFNSALLTWTIIIAAFLPYMSPLIAVEVVEDRENKVKNQLRVSGLDFFTYWSGILISHSAAFLVSVTIFVVVLVGLKIQFLQTSSAVLATCLLLILHIPSALLCCYVLSYMFDKHETAKSILPSLCSLPPIFLLMPVIILDMTGNQDVATYLHYVFCVLSPFYAPVGGLYFIARVQMNAKLYSIIPGLQFPTSVFSWNSKIPGTYIIMVLHVVVYYMLLRVVDVLKSGGHISDACFMKSSTHLTCNIEVPTEEDDDVKAERERIKNMKASCNSSSEQCIVMLDQVRKIYRPFLKCKKLEGDTKVAVRNVSLGIDSGNVFGLLGPNGAGKTTTAKMIIAEEAPSYGQVYIVGNEVKSNLSRAYKEMGYCPQEDALWKNLTVGEHLHLYAAIKGLPSSNISSICKEMLCSLHIEEFEKKKVKKLSGGTKRKLCFLISTLGHPKAVLLDEPSTGLDPQAKRYLWNFICNTYPPNGQHSVILTTHSMEEADALCTRVGIMVKGVMRCLGSTQHLKNKYGTGYTLDLKIGKNDDGLPFMNEAKQYIQHNFPSAEVKEEFEDRITFSIPQSIVSLANVFTCLEKAKSTYNIEEYSFSQTTLEQVFLGFAKEQEEHDISVI